MENFRKRIDSRLVRYEKSYLKRTSKPSYMSREIFSNDLFEIRKSKVTMTINKPKHMLGCAF